MLLSKVQPMLVRPSERVASVVVRLGDGGEGFVEVGADLVGFGAEEDSGEDGAVELLAHRHRSIGVGGVGVVQQVEGIADALPDLSSPTSLVTLDGAEDGLRVGGDLGLEGELLAVDLDGR